MTQSFQKKITYQYDLSSKKLKQKGAEEIKEETMPSKNMLMEQKLSNLAIRQAIKEKQMNEITKAKEKF